VACAAATGTYPIDRQDSSFAATPSFRAVWRGLTATLFAFTDDPIRATGGFLKIMPRARNGDDDPGVELRAGYDRRDEGEAPRKIDMAQTPPIRVLGICGSLRQASFNKAALRTAIKLAPPGMTIEEADISAIPPYDEDVYAKGFPPAVETLRGQIAEADALIFATPEYNFSIPGVLKNAIDWASRPPNQPFARKPVAIIGASRGMFGTARAQYHLRQVCVFLDMHPINKPEVMIGAAQTKFDGNGNLTDEPTRGFIAAALVALRDWTLKLKD
jgi:chromate reductase, NAD(P)H dehydrogenase (quinone)